jgi:hypothetical protein
VSLKVLAHLRLHFSILNVHRGTGREEGRSSCI